MPSPKFHLVVWLSSVPGSVKLPVKPSASCGVTTNGADVVTPVMWAVGQTFVPVTVAVAACLDVLRHDSGAGAGIRTLDHRFKRSARVDLRPRRALSHTSHSYSGAAWVRAA
jgi:hypothetical protein